MAKRKTKRELRMHLVIDSCTGELVCQNCRDRHSLTTPAPIRDVLDEMEQFCQRHENCKPVAAEQGQVS